MLSQGARAFLLLLLAALCAPAGPLGRPGLLPIKEVLHYQVEWRLLNAGTARLEWSETPGPQGWEVGLQLASTGLVSKLYKVNDAYKAHLERDLCAVRSHMDAQEGSRRREATVTYDRAARKARFLERDLLRSVVVNTREIDIPECVHDVVGGLYVLRSLALEPGQAAEIPVSDGRKSVLARVIAQEREQVKTPSGRHQALRYEVFLFNNVLYRRRARLYVWLTEDQRRLPVQVRVKMPFAIGTVTFQLAKEETG